MRRSVRPITYLDDEKINRFWIQFRDGLKSMENPNYKQLNDNAEQNAFAYLMEGYINPLHFIDKAEIKEVYRKEFSDSDNFSAVYMTFKGEDKEMKVEFIDISALFAGVRMFQKERIHFRKVLYDFYKDVSIRYPELEIDDAF